ncbi:hypothetical protein ACQPYH_39765 [Kribbella sp. CA-245084]|uniref:hypothetical protein n=1 Tax=Kribbella sp. CA-245084 TaxID=3239940 RepID=UPI003D9329E9
MDTATVAIIASAIGATGAIAGQLVAAAFTAKREGRKLDWEKKESAERRKNERERLFSETKRNAYVQLVQHLNGWRIDLIDLMPGHPHGAAQRLERIKDLRNDWRSPFLDTLAEVSLFSSEIEAAAGETYALLAEWQLALFHDDPIDRHDEVLRSFDDLKVAIRNDLGMQSTIEVRVTK